MKLVTKNKINRKKYRYYRHTVITMVEFENNLKNHRHHRHTVTKKPPLLKRFSFHIIDQIHRKNNWGLFGVCFLANFDYKKRKIRNSVFLHETCKANEYGVQVPEGPPYLFTWEDSRVAKGGRL